VVPRVEIGSIGGSGTWGARFPEDLGRPEVRVVDYLGPISTPYGLSSPLKLLEVGGKQVLRVAMHGWHRDEEGGWVPAWTCALQVGWLFQEAGVEWALVDGSVGGIQQPDGSGAPLPPWSVVITDDFIQYWLPPTPGWLAVRGSGGLRMREPFCAGLRRHLLAAASRQEQFTVYDRGVYVCTPTGRFETVAEIRMMAGWGAHVVGQTLGPEAPLMRQLGIHFGSLNIVSNYAEGNQSWIGEDAVGKSGLSTASCPPIGWTRGHGSCPTCCSNRKTIQRMPAPTATQLTSAPCGRPGRSLCARLAFPRRLLGLRWQRANVVDRLGYPRLRRRFGERLR
jgi:5'-methylthioadenosine phosphorylase